MSQTSELGFLERLDITPHTDDLRIISGSANPALSAAIADELGVPLTAIELARFADGETKVNILESVRGADVFVIQPTSPPVNDHVMDLLIILDTLKRASPRRVTAVIPYYGYSRQEKKIRPREPITARLVADLLQAAGAQRVLALDLHVQSIQGFFNVPVDHLTAGPLLADYLMNHGLGNAHSVVISPDVGAVGQALAFGERLGSSLAITVKRRPEPNRSEVFELIGDLEGKRAVIIDDIIDTGGTLISAAEVAIARGATEVYACATHPLLSHDAVELLERSPFKQVVVSDSIPLPEARRTPKFQVVSVAPLLAEAIKRVHADQSVSSLFHRYWFQDRH